MSNRRFNNLMRWRCIGPFRGGRVVAVAGDPQDRNVFYFGACAGGVWKTEDGGNYWTNISDGYFKTGSVGALAVSEADPNVIYAGMGESTIRIDVSHGDGVYKSTDGGQTWKHMGLADTRHIGKVRVHPHNPDIVYVAALGHAFGPNSERGVFKSTDGGETWKNVLFKSENAGAIDLSIDPNNPRILFATIWEARRNFWHMSSGGTDSGLYKSTDGGETWEEITGTGGLPAPIYGKVAVAVSPAKAGRVWALIECEKNALYRSDDYGQSWQMVSDKPELMVRAWYYTHLTADTTDPNRVYVNNLRLWCSTDGGRSFDEISTPHGDNHDIWIDPVDNQRMVQGNDGGANVSYNEGVTWSTIYNQPTAQFYRMTVDTQQPYRVYGTQQDNSCISVPSRSAHAAISWADCYLPGTGESGYIQVHPDDPNIVYHGAIGSSPGGGNALQRYDHRTGEIRLVTTYPITWRGWGNDKHKYRFSWTYPILISKHNHSRIYAAGNVVFQTEDEGQSWQPISEDLSRNDPEKLGISGGPINREFGAAETYCTVFAMAESDFEEGVLWAGTDDGLVYITRDNGGSWSNITPKGLPEWTQIHTIEASPFASGSAYLAATRYKLDDNTPYLYKTTDYGATWTLITDGIPADDFTRVIRADPAREGLLYAGTETGLYLSFDDGASWDRFQLNLPVTPIYDMLVANGDLIVGTHGRAFWILDDLSPLHQMDEAEKRQDGKGFLFKPRDTVRRMPFIGEDRLITHQGKGYMTSLGRVTPYTLTKDENGHVEKHFLESGENPPKGVMVSYNLAEDLDPEEKMMLSFYDVNGNHIRSYYRKPASEAEQKERKGPYLPTAVGYHRVVWDFRYPEVTKIEGNDSVKDLGWKGAIVPPGTYSVSLAIGKGVWSRPFEILPDYGVAASSEDLAAQAELDKAITDTAEAAVKTVNRMRDVRGQLAGWQKRLENEDLVAEAKALQQKITDIEAELVVPDLRPGGTDLTNAGGRLLDQLAALPPVVYLGNSRPTAQAYEVYELLSSAIEAEITKFQDLLTDEIDVFNQKASAAGVAVVQA
ncbi:MAG: glycosyl hydrolase [Chloroflexota bacterium]